MHWNKPVISSIIFLICLRHVICQFIENQRPIVTVTDVLLMAGGCYFNDE